MSEAWAIQQNTTFSKILELRWPEDDPNGAYRAGDKIEGRYAGTETRELVVWEGGDQAPEDTDTCTVTWESAARGELKVTLVAADTATWPVGRLYLQIYLQDGTGRFPVFPDDSPQPIDVLPAAGTAVDLPTYCSFADVVREAPWIRDVIGADPTRHADLEDYRNQARLDFDAILQRHYRPPHEVLDYNLDHLLDGGRRLRSGADDRTLATWLAQNRLVLTTTSGQRIKRWCALMTVWRLTKTEIGDSDQKTAYRKFGADCWHEANALLPTIVAEIDTTTPVDGIGDIAIDLGTADTLRG